MKKISKDVKQYLAAIGKKGGSAKSRAKADAVRENGKKGGRPKATATGKRRVA